MGQKIGIDTVVFIYLLEEHPHYLSYAENLFKNIQNGQIEAVFSVIGLIELLTGVKRRNRYDLAFSYCTLLETFPHLSLKGINEQIVEDASELRAKYGMSTPDAIHIATAIDFSADAFITNDKKLRMVKEIAVVLIEDR
jgi:predicted nucleic acid-binding protein